VSGPVLLLTDARTDAHAAPGHPERPERREAAASGVRDAAGEMLVTEAVEQATDADISRVHDPGYVELLTEAEARGGGWLDPDTYLVSGSMPAARLAAGATIRVARAAARGEAEVAFAVVRPPGHHAASAEGSGFCLLNSVAIAVAALRAGGEARRVAIVDWDVHHGDGTQAIFHGGTDLLYASTHQYPFYPGTGPASDDAGGTARNHPLMAGEAGFDAHVADPLAMLTVTEAGFEALAALLGATAARLGIDGVALTLEGGYDLEALRASTAATVRGLLEGRERA
jgi:acetoin utilization deacetylase AcuC-like enzyme